MNTPHINTPAASAAPFGAWWTPKLMRFAVIVALLLPGSFAVLPLIWLWHRRNGGRVRHVLRQQ